MLASDPVLAHIHVPKCAGTSVRLLLSEVWTESHLNLYVDGPTTFVYRASEIAELLRPRTVKAFSSHFVRTFPAEVGGRPMYYVTFLRDPLEQWISYLTYTRKIYHQIADPILRRHLPPGMPQLSLRECAQWLISHDTGTFLNFRENYTTNFFARYEVERAEGLEYADRRYRRKRLRVAREVLERFFFVGMADGLEESFWLLRRKLAGTPLEIPAIALPMENLSYEQREDLSWLTPEDPLGRQCLASLREDIRLYRWARARFERELGEAREGRPASGWRRSLAELSRSYYSTVTLLAKLRG